MANCLRCGAPVELQMGVCPHCGTTIQPESNFIYPDMPMKWYKFLVYFSLIFSAIINALVGFVSFITACESLLYSPILGFWDMLYAVAIMILAIYCLVVRHQLKHYRRFAPYLYLALLVIPDILDFVHGIISYILYILIYGIFPTPTIFPFLLGICMTSIMFACNFIYFHKRRHLFQN